MTTDERMTKYYVREYERLMKRRFPACSAVMKKPIEQSLTILDIEGIGVTALVGRTRSFVQLAITIGQDYYPEMLGNMYILNNGYFFSAAWAIIKNFIDDKTTKKIQMLGLKYQEKLLEFIDADNLPEFLGGKCTCSGIEGGCLYLDIGPWNPKGGISI